MELDNCQFSLKSHSKQDIFCSSVNVFCDEHHDLGPIYKNWPGTIVHDNHHHGPGL